MYTGCLECWSDFKDPVKHNGVVCCITCPHHTQTVKLVHHATFHHWFLKSVHKIYAHAITSILISSDKPSTSAVQACKCMMQQGNLSPSHPTHATYKHAYDLSGYTIAIFSCVLLPVFGKIINIRICRLAGIVMVTLGTKGCLQHLCMHMMLLSLNHIPTTGLCCQPWQSLQWDRMCKGWRYQN